jgi:FixJ family two-component response regulator
MRNSATRANRTRSNRRAFAQVYGPVTADVVRLIARGWTSDRIAYETGETVNSVAAFRANVTRGAYAPFVSGDLVSGFTGSCNF